jgi:hypothetical protein
VFGEKTGRTLLAAVGIAAALLSPATVLAGKGGGTTPWVTMASVDGARTPLSDGSMPTPHLGSWVTFATGYPTTVKNPRLDVLCYQNGVLTFGMTGGVSYSYELGGASSAWLTNGGEADCTTNLYYYSSKAGKQTYNWLASYDFHAMGAN